MTDKAHPAYRPDIDGLRAIAVLVVVLYHAGVPGLPGGFVGVDIFFVISGFLIGGQIYRERQNGQFSYLDFYARRLRRIMPALIVLLATTMLIGALILTPEEYRDLGKEGFASVFGLSNILFYLGKGYFAPAADMQPLLMTWSLGVEEQFYLLFPVLLLIITRFKRLRVLPVITVLTLISFTASLWLVEVDPQAAFYLLPTRSWELGIGAVLAIRSADGKQFQVADRHPNIIAGLALVLIGVSVGLFASETQFPGLFAILPVAAGALLIATPASIINQQLLSHKVMRAVGWISYSWYLWHWPIFYLHRVVGGEKGWGIAPAFIFSLVMAWLSWRFIEQPLRKRVLPDRVAVMRYALVLVITAVPALLIYRSDGVPARLPTQGQFMAAQAAAAHDNVCLTRSGISQIANLDLCVPPLKSGQKERTLVIGDSHASALAPALAEQTALRRRGFGQLTKSSCLPFAGAVRLAPERSSDAAECLAYQRAVLAYINQHPEITEIILAAYWSTGKNLATGPDATKTVPFAVGLDQSLVQLKRTGRRIILIADPPEFDFDPYARRIGAYLPLRTWLSGGGRGSGVAGGDQVNADPTRITIRQAAQRHGTGFIDPRQTLCSAKGCRYASEGAVYYLDRHHITASGGRIILGLPEGSTKPVSWPLPR